MSIYYSVMSTPPVSSFCWMFGRSYCVYISAALLYTFCIIPGLLRTNVFCIVCRSAETTGIACSPDGKHMYFAYQQDGVVFDVTLDPTDFPFTNDRYLQVVAISYRTSQALLNQSGEQPRICSHPE